MTPALPGHYSLDSFRQRGDRFLFARRRDEPDQDGETPASGELVYLEQGEARAMRSFARSALRCPEPDCSASDITTVSRSAGGARDGYRHLRRPVDGAHAPESVMHRQAKAVVARWASAHPSVATVKVEASLGGGERIADVLLTSRSGNRLAVEVQFASLSLDEYLARTSSYASLGVPVVWLWGNSGHHSPRVGTINALHRHAVRDARPVLWINPADETIAWALRHDWHGQTRTPRALGPGDKQYDVEFGSLEDLDLRATGLYPPRWAEDRARARARAHHLALAEHAEREAKRRRLEESRARSREEKPAFSKAPWRPAPQPIRQSEHNCRRCGLPLDPVLWAAGRHFGDCTGW